MALEISVITNVYFHIMKIVYDTDNANSQCGNDLQLMMKTALNDVR